MDDCNISVLSGDALRRAFLKAVHTNAVGVDGTPLVAADVDGSIAVFYR